MIPGKLLIKVDRLQPHLMTVRLDETRRPSGTIRR